MKKFSLTVLSGLLLLLSSCEELFLFNPNQIRLNDDQRDINAKNITRIQAQPAPDTLRFILMGDTQRWYDESADFVASANAQPGISFVLHAGDISDFGLTQEFEWVHDIMSKLKVPYLAVIGNHDLVANGPIAYRRLYGPFNYSFEYAGNRFVFVNTNSREYAFDGSTPDLAWLREELSNNPYGKNTVVIGHVPPFDGDFDKSLEAEFASLLANNHVKLGLFGHQHDTKDGVYYNDGVHYYITTSMMGRAYLLVELWEGGQRITNVKF